MKIVTYLRNPIYDNAIYINSKIYFNFLSWRDFQIFKLASKK